MSKAIKWAIDKHLYNRKKAKFEIHSNEVPLKLEIVVDTYPILEVRVFLHGTSALVDLCLLLNSCLYILDAAFDEWLLEKVM